MKVTRFDTSDDLIIVTCRIWRPGHRDRRRLRLVLDTGAAETIIVPDVLDDLGDSPPQAEAITRMRSAVGREHGYLIRITQLDGLGHTARNLRVHAHDLPDGWNIDGLIGLPFLREFNYEVRSGEGRLCVERV